MPLCYTCQEEIAFDKNILSKTGKQIPLTADKKYAHGHDEEGNPIRRPLPEQPQRQLITSTTATTDGGSTLDTKRIFQILKEQDNRLYAIDQKLDRIFEKIEYNTQVDTDKLIGQLQTIEEVMTPALKTQIKKGSDLYNEQQEEKKIINHGEKADRFQNRRNTPVIGELPKEEDANEFEKTKQFVPENNENSSEIED